MIFITVTPRGEYSIFFVEKSKHGDFDTPRTLRPQRLVLRTAELAANTHPLGLQS